jgi:hypothetical protein
LNESNGSTMSFRSNPETEIPISNPRISNPTNSNSGSPLNSSMSTTRSGTGKNIIDAADEVTMVYNEKKSIFEENTILK